MKVKWLVFTVILNIFIVLMVSILLEYNNLSSRLQIMEGNVTVALETAVDTAMMSEEFFSEGFTDRYYSYARTTNANSMMSLHNSADSAPSMDYSRIFLYRGGQWIAGNTYVMAYAYQKLGRFPETQQEINTYTNKFAHAGHGTTSAENYSRATIFSWLYGAVGQWYTSANLKKWSSTNLRTIKDYQDMGLGFGDTGAIAGDEATQVVSSHSTTRQTSTKIGAQSKFNKHNSNRDGSSISTKDIAVTAYSPSAKVQSLFSASNAYHGTAVWEEGIDGLSPSPDFAKFYNTIGQLVLSRSPAKVRHTIGKGVTTMTADSFKVENVVYPTLWNMGLTFSGTQWMDKKNTSAYRNQLFYNHSVELADGTVSAETNSVPTNTSNVMTDNWCASYHIGKQMVNASGVAARRSIYMLTPMSLGVTYVPLKVAKPLFVANLENIVRFGRLKARTNQGVGDTTISRDAFEGANYDIGTAVYGDWEATAENTHHLHEQGGAYLKRSDNVYTDYITDGQVEYDMSSIRMKVDYFYVDFSDPDNYDIVNRCVGASPIMTTTDGLDKAAKTISSKDTATRYFNGLAHHLVGQSTEIEKDCRIVAKITARVRVQVPYQAPIMQWSRQLINLINGNPQHEHYGIRALYRGDNSLYTSKGYASDGTGDIQIDEESDGLWFSYTTYRAISR